MVKQNLLVQKHIIKKYRFTCLPGILYRIHGAAIYGNIYHNIIYRFTFTWHYTVQYIAWLVVSTNPSEK